MHESGKGAWIRVISISPAPIGEGDLSDEWLRFKREFQQSLTAIRKEDATEQVKLAIFLRIVDPRAICMKQ